MNKNLKIAVFGFLTWLVPFVASWFFYSKGGEPLIDIFLIKTIMIVVFSAFGALLLVKYFRSLERDFLKEGIIVGVVWLLINWMMDIIVLLPMSEMNLATYFAQIGLRYLMIPTMSITIGYMAEWAHRKQRKNIPP